MKKIRVKICGHPVTDTYAYSYYILTTLKKYYEVELSDDPEYLFYNESTFDHHLYTCVKIFYTGENTSPNFNLCDYAIGFDYMTFEDRYYRMPLYLVAVFYTKEEHELAGKEYLYKKTIFTKENLQQKTDFCSFIYSNYRSDVERKHIYELLSTYKKVNAAGSYLNNTGGTKVRNKLAYDTKHKFTIAFENSSRSGYTTEKLVAGLVAQTIPIYWGNPHIGKEFNTKRFINCHDYASFEEVLEKVKELDSDDTKFLQMINEPITVENYDFKEIASGFDTFLRQIIDQPKNLAKRNTINPVRALLYTKHEKIIEQYTKRSSLLLAIISKLYKPFKKIAFIEKYKYAYFSIKK